MTAKFKQQVRVISGSLKGKRLRYPPGREIRPSMQQIKAAVFDSIGTALRDTVFIDLFAGAGGVGIEAMSRGAAFVHFVEDNPKALQLLETNLTTCGLSRNHVEVHPVNVIDFLEGERSRQIHPDFVYADPPYDSEDPITLLVILDSLRYSHNCLIILEHRRDLPMDERLRLTRTKIMEFGRSWVSFFVPMGGDKR